ncbi:MAG: Gfo/Idh/MocA family oxidoreductase [Candidatus Pacebacteria bacterium]|nr:Gfo/Idh/MocA family oxidoreductase [Candidatus Paceibacterota bacterium]
MHIFKKEEQMNGAIIGCGNIAFFHARAYPQVEKVRLVAVCDKNLHRARKIASLAKNCQIFTDYKKMLKEVNNLDFVEVLTPHSTHLEIVKEIVKKGLSVNLQKVQTVTAKDYKEMLRICEKKKARLRVFENFRYYQPYRFAKKLIDKSRIGQAERVQINKIGGSKWSQNYQYHWLRARKWRITQKENYSHPVLFDDGYHKHSLVEFFLGQKITRVRSWCGYKNILPGLKIDSPAAVEYFTDRDAYGLFNTINTKMRIPHHFYPCDEEIEIVGTGGVIKIYGGHGLLFSEKNRSSIRQGVYLIDQKGKWQFFNSFDLDIRQSFVAGLAEFVKFIKGDISEKDLIFNQEDAFQTLRIGLAIINSLKKNGRIVKV